MITRTGSTKEHTRMGARRDAVLAVVLVAATASVLVAAPAGADHRSVRQGDGDIPSVRWAGQDRIGTAAALATEYVPGGPAGPTDVALLATGDGFADALAGGYLAGRVGGPILLTDSDSLTPATREKLADGPDSLDVSSVVLLGGEEAIGPGVERELNDEGYDVERIAGDDRIATAAAVATHPGSSEVGTLDGRRTAVLARMDGFADALVAGALSAGASLPLLLTDAERLSEPTRAALVELDVDQVVVAGGPQAVSEAVAEELRDDGFTVLRVGGEDRLETAVAFSELARERLGFDGPEVALAAAEDFPDALALAPFAGVRRMPVLLTGGDRLAEPTRDRLEELRTCDDGSTLYVAGGTAAVSEAAEDAARRALTGPNCEQPSPEPTSEPSPSPEPEPSDSASPSPSASPTPSSSPSPQPSDEPSQEPQRGPQIVGANGQINITGLTEDFVDLDYSDELLDCDRFAPEQFTYTDSDSEAVAAERLECERGPRVLTVRLPFGTLDNGDNGTLTYTQSMTASEQVTDADGHPARNPQSILVPCCDEVL